MGARYRWDEFLLDLDAYRLERAGAELPLEPKALDLLALMVRRPGHLFTKQEIFEAIWPETSVTDHALTRVVSQLRRALGDEARQARYLETVPTRGYRWTRAVEAVADEEIATPPLPKRDDGPGRNTGAPGLRGRPRLPFRLAAAVLLLTVVGVVIGSSTRRASSTPGTTGETVPAEVKGAHRGARWPVQVTTHKGLDLHPALSPAGDAIAFASERTGSFEVYVRGLAGTSSDVPLTSDGGQNVQPAWSPDGRLIAYHSYRRGGIWVIPARGGASRQVVESGSRPAWSPDGRRLAFQSDEHADVAPTGFGAQSGSTLMIVEADGGNPQPLTLSGGPMGGHAAPAWNADGRFLAFTVFEAGTQNGLWVLNLETRRTTLLAQGAGFFETVFAPDGSALYVAGGDALILRVPFDPVAGVAGGPAVVIPVPGVPGVRGVTMSPDGGQIGFAGLALDSQIWAQPVARDGTPRGPSIPLTSDTSQRNSVPAISPDGSRVAYMSTRRGDPPNVWVMSIEGRDAIQLTPDRTAAYAPSWLPDGRHVAYVSGNREERGLWSVDIATRRPALLFDIAGRLAGLGDARSGGLAEIDLSGSAKRVAFSILTPPAGRRALYAADVESFAPRALTDGTQSVGYPAWSPDGRRVAVQIKDGSSTHAGYIDVETGTLRQLTHDRGQTWARSWSPDGGRIAAAAFRDGVWNLRWIAVDGGRQGNLTPAVPSGGYVRYPEWSPLGNTVLFERAEMRGNIWTLNLR